MNKFHNIFEKYIKDSEKRKRYVAFLLSLSMLVMFFVPLGLTENADSMTALSPGGAIITEQLKNATLDNSMLAEGAVDLSNTSSDSKVQSFTPNVMNKDTSEPIGDSQVEGNSVVLTFNVVYTVGKEGNNLKKYFNSTDSKAHFYFPLNIDSNDSAAYELTFTGVEGKPIYDENYKGGEDPAGHYTVKDGYVYITLTSGYISEELGAKDATEVGNQTGIATGTLNFEGTLNNNSNEDESCKLTVGSEEITVNFKLPEKTLGNLVKTNSGVKHETTGDEVNWKIELNKSAGFDLNGYSLVDAMFAKAKAGSIKVKVNGAEVADYGQYDSTNNKITFNNNDTVKNAETITIEYTTPLDDIFGKLDTNGDNTIDVEYINNTVTLKKSDDTVEKTGNSTITINKPTIDKVGTPDYQSSGKAENKIDWTITINNNSNLNLKGYTIEDRNFPNDISKFEIKDNSGKTINATVSNGVLTLPDNVGNPQKITIKYKTDNAYVKQPTDTDNGNNNTATLKKGNLTIHTDSENPEYKSESAMYNIEKNGSYNKDTGKITWTVTVRTTEDKMSLTGYKLSDSAFNGKSLSDFNFTHAGDEYNNWTNNAGIGTYVDFSNGVMTFKNDNNKAGLKKVVFTYTTDANPSTNEDTYPENSIELDNPEDNPVVSTKVSVKVDKVRNTFTKTVKDVNNNNVSVGKTNAAREVTLKWTVTLISDNGFAGKTFDDIFTAKYGDTNLSSEIKNVHLYPRDTQNGSNKAEITSGFTASGADIKFNNDFNIKEHYVVVEYDTVVTLPAVNDSSAYDDNGKITYNINNKGDGSFGKGPGENGVDVTITRENPNANNTTVSFTKQWNNKPASINKIYVYVTATSNGKTYFLAGTEGSYKLVENPVYELASANGNGVLFEVSDSNWSKSFTGLPTSKESGDSVVYYNDYTVHEYSISDINANKFGNNNYVKLSDNSIVVKSGDGNSITNTYYPNKELTVNKNWDGDEGKGSDINSVTVQVERKASNSNNWEVYKENITISRNNSGFLDSQKLDGEFPTAEIKDNNVVTYEYRVVETGITASGKTFTKKTSENNKVIFVDASGNYYETNESFRVDTYATAVTLTNTYHKAGTITIKAQKKWYCNSGEYASLEELRSKVENVDTHLKSIDLKLQRRVQGSGDAGWEDVEGTQKHTISATATAPVEWNNLPNQAMVEGELVKYEYRVVECGFTTTFNDDGTTDNNSVNITGNVIAPSPNTGRYDISYDGGSSNDKNVSSESKTITVKNTYVADSPISVTPKKNWTYDSSDNDYNKKENRADSVTFVLQQYNSKGNKGKWADYKVKVGDKEETVKVTFTKSANEPGDSNSTEWKECTVSPSADVLTNLPKEWLEKEIVDSKKNIRKYTIVQYKYRFVEESVTVNNETISLNYEDIYAENLNGETKSIKFASDDGKYISSISSPQTNDGTFTVENKFKPNIGIEKYSINKNAHKITSLEKDQLEQYKHTFDGVDYYVFNYVVEYTKAKEMSSVIDKLPEGFSLVEEFHSCAEAGNYFSIDISNGKKLSLFSGMNPKDAIWTNGKINASYPDYIIADGYYASPMMFLIDNKNQGNEYVAYFNGWNNTYQRDENGNYIYTRQPLSEVFKEKSGRYNYNEDTRTLTLGNVNVEDGKTTYLGYSIKIEKAKLEEKIANGTFQIVNKAEKHEIDGTDTGLTSENTLVITTPDNLIKKDFAETNIPGYVTYTIDVNPDGKTLSNGSTVRIKDVFDTISYTLRDNCSVHKKTGGHNPVTTSGSRLIDVMLNSLDVYAYDANGNKTKLKSNQYTSVFKNGSDAEEGAATLELNVPDSTHISIEYTYKLIANENTPSVIQGCKSTTLKNGRYPIMASGMIPPAGDKISMRNRARLETESNSAEKEKVVNEYEIAESSGTISTTKLPKIRKVNIADQTINDLKADFLLARYIEDDKGEKGWQYATNIGDASNAKNRDVTWSEKFSNDKIPEGIFTIHLNGDKPYEVNLSDGVLYKLIEVKVPDKYEGSNLKKVVNGQLVDFTADDYKELITNYFNTKETVYKGTDYSNFLTTFVFEHYFVYNAIPSSITRPATLNTNDVMQIQTGGIVDVPNNELIDIKVQKDWVDFNETINGKAVNKDDTSVILQLFWSDKNEDSIPDNAKPAEANELGIVNYEGINEKENYVPFSSVVEVPYGTDATTVWTQLPNGNGLTPIYYYVKEIGYRIGKANDSNSILYMLEETVNSENGKTISTYKHAESYEEVLPKKADEQVTVEVEWVKDSTKIGNYLPTYVNNAVNSNVIDSESVKITNSQVLRLKKVWTDAENKVLPANSNKIGVGEIEVAIYGVYANKAQTSEPLFEAKLTGANGWIAEIPQDTLKDIDLSQFESFVAKETGLPPLSEGKAFITSVTFRINNNTGEITVTNKNPDAVSASVSVNKTWSDGNDVHKSDSIEVTLYQVEKSKADAEKLGDSPTLEQLTKVSAVVYNPPTSTATTAEGEGTSGETATVPYNPVTLNAANNWSHVWSGLPIDDGDETSAEEYVYYVVESKVNISQAKDKYTPAVTLVRSGSNYAYTISNNRPSVTVKKEWYDENGKPLLVYDEDGNLDAEHSKTPPDDSVQVRLYKKGESVPANGLKLIAFGDSITDGYGSSEPNCSKNGKDYPSKLINLLKNNNYTIVNAGQVGDFNKGESGQQIGGSNSEGFRSRINTAIPSDTNVICFLGGTNDIHQQYSSVRGNPQGVYDRFEACITEIKAQAPNAVIFVGSIPHFDFYKNGSATDGGNWWNWLTDYNKDDGKIPNGYIDEYNAKIKAYAEKTAGVYYVDVCSVVTDDYIRADGCHPNEAGYTAIANAYYDAISNYYTPKEYLKEDGTFTTNANDSGIVTRTILGTDNWTKVIDLPKNFDTTVKLSVEEVANENLTNWTAEYENNSQTALSSEVIVVKNTNTPPKTTIEINKKWQNDEGNYDGRAKMAFRIFRSTDRENWEEVEAERDETFGDKGILKDATDENWTIRFKKFPAESPKGDPYYYKIEEEPLAGYTSSVEADSKPAVKDQIITFSATNTRAMSITVEKFWDDKDQDTSHSMDTVKVRLWRTTDSTKVNENLPLSLMVKQENGDILQSGSSVSMGNGTEMTLTANRDAEFTSSDSEVVSVANGTLTALAAGTATITVSAGNEKVEINVEVVALTLTAPETITAGDNTQKATVSADGKNITDVSYSSSNTNVLTINNEGNITAHDVGTAEITVTCKVGGKVMSTKKTITVGYTDGFTLEDEKGNIGTADAPIEIAINSEIKLTPDPNYGKFDFEISGDGATIVKAQDGKSVTVKAGSTENKTVTITAKQGENTSSCVVKVVANPAFVLMLNGEDVTNTHTSTENSYNDPFKVPLTTGLTFTSNKIITKIKVSDKWRIRANSTDADEVTINSDTFTINKGGMGLCSDNYVWFEVYFNGEGSPRRYFAIIVDKSTVEISSPINSITVSENAQTFNITAKPDGATITATSLPQGVTFENGVLTVSPDASEGTVTLTATKEGYNEATLEIPISLPTIQLSASDTSVRVGATNGVELTVTPSDGITFTSSYEGVVIDGNKVTANSKPEGGTVTITASKTGYKSASIDLDVLAADEIANEIVIEDITLNAMCDLSKYDYKKVKWIGLTLIAPGYDFNNENINIKSYTNNNWGGELTNATINTGTFPKNSTKTFYAEVSELNQYLMVNVYSVTLVSVKLYNNKPAEADDSIVPANLSLRAAPMAILAGDEPEQTTGGIEWTDNGDGREYYEFEIHANPDNWKKTITGLEVANNGQYYYYWVEETPVPVNYEASYSYDKEFNKRFIQQTDGKVVIKNTQGETFDGVEMPSTGGSGTNPYTTAGIIITGGAAITLLALRRKRKSA